jgi:hypothetical protein
VLIAVCGRHNYGRQERAQIPVQGHS